MKEKIFFVEINMKIIKENCIISKKWRENLMKTSFEKSIKSKHLKLIRIVSVKSRLLKWNHRQARAVRTKLSKDNVAVSPVGDRQIDLIFRETHKNN